MKNKLFYTLLLSLSLLILSAHDSSAQAVDREIGLRMTGLDNFNFIYKKAREENKFLRVRAGGFNINLNDNARNGAINLAMGWEKRKAIDDKLFFIHGFEPALLATASDAGFNDRLILNLSLGYVLGFHLNVTDHFGVNIETIPSLNIGTVFTENNDTENSLGLGFNSNAIALTAVYRFTK